MCILRREFHRQTRHKARAFEDNFGPGGQEFERSNLQKFVFQGEVEVYSIDAKEVYSARPFDTVL